MGGDIELKINLKNISSNRVLYSESIMLPKKSLPIGVDLRPKNYNQIVSLDKKLRDGSNTKGFDIWPDKGNGSIYKDGENLSMRLAKETADFIKQQKDSAFFAFLSFYAVHGPIQTTEQKWKKYRDKAEAQA